MKPSEFYCRRGPARSFLCSPFTPLDGCRPCYTAPLKTILTSRKFIELGGLESLAQDLAQAAELIYLEDLKEQIGTGGKLRAVLGPIFPKGFAPSPSPDAPGVILFTSGTGYLF